VTYDEVKVTLDAAGTDETTNFADTGNFKILAAIPESVDRNSNVEVISKITAGFVAAADEIKGNVGGEGSTKENYAKLYRTVTANHPTTTTVYWTFTPFKDESIVPGTNYLVALIEARDRTHRFLAKVHTNCTYGTPILFGLLEGTPGLVLRMAANVLPRNLASHLLQLRSRLENPPVILWA